MRDLFTGAIAAPVTLRGERVLAILRAARDRVPLDELRVGHDEWWPRTGAGDRMWSRDKRDALAGRVYGPEGARAARRDRLVDLLEDRGALTITGAAEALGCSRFVAEHELRMVGARQGRRGRLGRRWFLEPRARRARAA